MGVIVLDKRYVKPQYLGMDRNQAKQTNYPGTHHAHAPYMSVPGYTIHRHLHMGINGGDSAEYLMDMDVAKKTVTGSSQSALIARSGIKRKYWVSSPEWKEIMGID